MTLGPWSRRAGLVLVVVLVVIGLAGVGGYTVYLNSTREVADSGGVITEGLVVDGPLSVLPPFAQAENSRDIAGLLYRGLTRTGPDGRPVGDIASKWEASADSKTFTFHIKSKQTWSDGAAISASDARFTLSILQSDALSRSPTGQAWSGISAHIVDDVTIQYTLSSANAGFPSLAGLGLLPEHALSQRPAEAMAEIVDAPTSGPFFVAHTDRDRLELKRNPRAARVPYLDELDFRLFASARDAVSALTDGQIDVLAQLTPDDANRVAGAPNKGLVTRRSYSYVQLLFNQKQATLGDVAVRRAIATAIDHSAIVGAALHGYGHVDNTPIPPAISWASDNTAAVATDLDKARKALDAAGWKVPAKGSVRQKDGADLKLKLTAADQEPYATVARRLEIDLGRVGIKVEPDMKSQDALLGTLQSRQFDMAVDAVDNGPDPDIYTLWHSSQGATGGFNFSNMPANAALDKDLETGRQSSDQKTRHDAYMDAQRIFRETLATVILYSPDMLIGVSHRVRNVSMNPGIEPGDRFEYVDRWYVQSHRVRK